MSNLTNTERNRYIYVTEKLWNGDISQSQREYFEKVKQALENKF